MNNRKVINISHCNSYLHFLCWLKESLCQASKKELVHFFEREQTSPKVTEAKERALCGSGKKSFPSRRPAGGTTRSTMQANAEAKRAWTMLSCEEKKMRSILTYSIVLSPQPCYGRRIFSFTPHVAFSDLQPTGNTSDIFYYHTNHLGSTAFVTDNNATITQGFLYAPFGEITTEYAPLWQNGTLPKYSFNAKELDEETGMYYYEARYYKPPVFTSRDPMFEKYFWMTPYAYCANNPVKYVDPDGREIWISAGGMELQYKEEDGKWYLFDSKGKKCDKYNEFIENVRQDLDKIRIAAQKDDVLKERFSYMVSSKSKKYTIVNNENNGCHFASGIRQIQYDRTSTEYHIDKAFKEREFQSSLVHELLGHAYSHSFSIKDFYKNLGCKIKIGNNDIDQDQIDAINIENRFRYVRGLPSPRTQELEGKDKDGNNIFYDISSVLNRDILNQWVK